MLNAKRLALAFATLLTLTSAIAHSSGDQPEVLSIQFPEQLGTYQSAQGTLSYRSGAGLSRVQFDVVDGRYHRQDVRVTASQAQGDVRFSLACTAYAQSVSLRVTAWDPRGQASAPRLLAFDCGQPPRYNFSQVLSRAQPAEAELTVNVFVLDDGVTALTEGATPLENPIWSEPAADVRAAFHGEILDAVNGIWDQCGVGFKGGLVRVLHPDRLRMPGGTLADKLFEAYEREPAILHGTRTGAVMHQARSLTLDALEDEGLRFGPADLTVFVTGLRILTAINGQYQDIEGFGEITPPHYTIVRWGALYDREQFVLPRQMVTTLAHELGHNLGLGHPGSDGLNDTQQDPNNLMKGSGVTPEPRAHLLPSQCQRVARTLARIEAERVSAASQRADAGPEASVQSASTGARLQWVGLQPDQVLGGPTELVIEATGLDLDGFGFAEFAYSPDGERFVQIGLDRTPGDGFGALWETTSLRDGRYQLRATVTDANRQRVSTSAWVTVRN